MKLATRMLNLAQMNRSQQISCRRRLCANKNTVDAGKHTVCDYILKYDQHLRSTKLPSKYKEVSYPVRERV